MTTASCLQTINSLNYFLFCPIIQRNHRLKLTSLRKCPLRCPNIDNIRQSGGNDVALARLFSPSPSQPQLLSVQLSPKRGNEVINSSTLSFSAVPVMFRGQKTRKKQCNCIPHSPFVKGGYLHNTPQVKSRLLWCI